MLTRILSSLVLIPIVVGIIWFAPPIATKILLIVVAVIGLNEARNLMPGRWPAGTALALVWILLPLTLLSLIRESHPPSVIMFLFVLIVVSDSAQYFAGRTFGKHKLAPVISPKKTIEGSIGGLVAAAAVAPWIASYWLPEVDPVKMAIAAAVIAIAGMAGDLFESALKRKAGIKDSGNLIPGHGGILDRIDAFLFAAPVYYVFLRYIA